LIKNGKIERGYIGVSIKDVDMKEAKGLGLDKAKGVLIQNVIKGGAGEEAGLKTGDIIFTVDGKEVNAANELQTIIGSKRPGENASLTVFRDGKTIDVQVKLKPKTNDVATNIEIPEKKKEEVESNSRKFENLGLIVTELTDDIKKQNVVEYGVVVKDVAHFSEAFNRGLRTGYVIIEADKQKINNISDLESIINKKSKGDIIVLKTATQMKDIRLIALEIQ
jgi:serine protease Do